MYICFAEYRIQPEHRLKYLEMAAELQKDESRSIQWYEGTDQPGLFVEVWHAQTEEEAEQIKEERCSERSSWGELSQWIIGGKAKLHVWTFKPVPERRL